MAKKTATQKQPSLWEGAFSAFGKAFDRLKANPGPALLFIGVYLLVSIIQPRNLNYGKEIMLFGSLETLVFLLFLLALPIYGLAIADRKRISLGDVMDFDAKKYFTVLAASILYGLIVLGSLLLLVFPAVWTVAWFAVCVFAAIDKNLGPVEALKESKRLLKNHKSKVWGIIGATIALSFGAGLVAIIPVVGYYVSVVASSVITLLSTAATAILFRWIQSQPEQEV